MILFEAAARIRRQLSLSQQARYDRPLVVVLTKCDAWLHLLSSSSEQSPGRGRGASSAWTPSGSRPCRWRCGRLVLRVCPELVQAAEGFFREVLYVPVSTLGHAPRQDSSGPAIRPADIKPVWVTVPVLYGMYRWMRGLVPGLKRNPVPVSPGLKG